MKKQNDKLRSSKNLSQNGRNGKNDLPRNPPNSRERTPSTEVEESLNIKRSEGVHSIHLDKCSDKKIDETEDAFKSLTNPRCEPIVYYKGSKGNFYYGELDLEKQEDGSDSSTDSFMPTDFILRRIAAVIKRTSLKTNGAAIMELWENYEQKSSAGVAFEDLISLSNLFQALGELVVEVPFSKKLLLKIVSHCSKGFCCKTIGVNVEEVTKGLNKLGWVLINSNSWIQSALAEIMTCIIGNMKEDDTIGKNKNPQRSKKMPSKNISKERSKVIFEESLLSSKFPDALTKLILEGFPDSVAYHAAMQILSLSVREFKSITARVFEQGVLDAALKKLELVECDSDVLPSTVHLVFGFFEALSPINESPVTCDLDKIAPSMTGFQALLDKLFSVMSKWTSEKQINLRNDIAFSIFMLNRLFPMLGEYYGPFSEALEKIISNNVMNTPQNLKIEFILEPKLEDLDLLKYLLWMFAFMAEKDEDNLENILGRGNILRSLLCIMDWRCSHLLTEDKGLCPMSANVVTCAWDVLTEIARYSPNAFLQGYGIEDIIDILFREKEEGTINPDFLLMISHVLRTLYVEHENEPDFLEGIAVYTQDPSIMRLFIDICQDLIAKTDINNVVESVLSNLLLCCCAMSKASSNQSEVFCQTGGVKLIIHLMQRLLSALAVEGTMIATLQIVVAETTQKCIGDSVSGMEMFLAYEGIFRLLALLELAAGPAAQMNILNCILDLCSYPRCMDQLLYWKRPKRPRPCNFSRYPNDDKTVGALLCEIWREEENSWQVKRTEHGCIADIKHPLKGEIIDVNTFTENLLMQFSPMHFVYQMFGSVRPKIYLLSKKITEATNTEATLFDGLGVENQVTMQIIINYLDLATCEQWQEMEHNFRKNKVQLVPSDDKLLQQVKQTVQNKCVAVLDTQEYLRRRAIESNEMSEKEFYSMIKNCSEQNRLKFEKEMDMLARTSNYAYLVECRLSQLSQLKLEENKMVESGTRLHRTSDGPLNITTWPGRCKLVQSEPTFINNGFANNQDTSSQEEQSYGHISTNLDAVTLMSDATSKVLSQEHGRTLWPSIKTSQLSTPNEEEGINNLSPDILTKALLKLMEDLNSLRSINTSYDLFN